MTPADTATAPGEATAVSHPLAPSRRARVKHPSADVADSYAPTSRIYELAKRTLDIVVSIVAILLSSPLMVAISIALKLESPRAPVWFAHIRIGKSRRPFPCWKFRSMRVGAANELLIDSRLKTQYVSNDYKVPVELDPRVTRVGGFLRQTSLDELPQLFNVLAGSMSLVGPRPVVREELQWYGSDVDEFLSVKPGITGVWQVQGRSRIGYPERVDVELRGIRMRSFWSDLKILTKSVPAVIMARGAL